MTAADALRELRDRFTEAVDRLETVAADARNDDEAKRLQAKASGVRLAISYVDEELRIGAES